MQSKNVQSRGGYSGRPGWITLPEREKIILRKLGYSMSHIPTLERESTSRANRQYSYIYIYIYWQKCNPVVVAQVEYFANLRLWHLCRLLSFWWSECNFGPYLDGSPHCWDCPVFDRVVDGQARESRFEGRPIPFVAVIFYMLLFCISLHIVKTTL